ncbi:MAG: hypothetical protein NPIRA05_01040 [Nitrospirales bacterium]|nr:MAG: hypothetical protein NPIRA05_01040 [Nitrospirales bacterium]GJL83988.1 MAG: hypothetical protein DHS20C01_36220 [marine bacterium B5-7]
MMTFREQQQLVRDLRQQRDMAEQSLRLHRTRLAAKQVLLAHGHRRVTGATTDIARLEREIAQLASTVNNAHGTLTAAKHALTEAVRAFTLLDNPRQLIEELNDRLPILLLPVRIETRFMTENNSTELWVRIFPDDIAVHSHEKGLTVDEVESGLTYWRELWHARQQEEDAQRETQKKGAWRALAGEFGSTRAAWVARETEPDTLDVNEPSQLVFPTFDPETLKQESWTQAPRSKVMPDRFVVTLYAEQTKIAEVVGAQIPDPLITGPDPQLSEEELVQRGGDILPGPNLDWLYDFDRAVELGMAVRVPLTEPRQIDRLLVMGLRLSSDEQDSKSLLEELLDNHHYSQDGMGLILQGTPTNNTDAQGSGFSSVDPGAERGYAVETGEAMFELTDQYDMRSDAQRLIQALGIDHSLMQHVEQADRFDVREAQLMNTALWPATAGYFIEELIGLSPDTVRRVRDFFISHVAGRGTLPALRVGIQPYGILPTSSFERWKFSSAVNDPQDVPFMRNVHKVLTRLDQEWARSIDRVSHVHKQGDSFDHLLSTLGLHATSVQYHRRHGVGREYIWNYQQFTFTDEIAKVIQAHLVNESEKLLQELGLDFTKPPKITELAFFKRQDDITDPLIEDVDAAENERWSEKDPLQSLYKIDEVRVNYIGWLVAGTIDDIKRQQFLNETDERQPIPKALLYRMLRRALLLAYHDTTLQLYENHGVVESVARREIELSNVRAKRTVTRWEFMEAKIAQVLPQVSRANISLVEFLQTPEGKSRPEASFLGEVRDSLAGLSELSTASLERLFAEHLDLCSYRLDAWQTGLFTERLERLRNLQEDSAEATTGIYLGAFGWLENIKPGGPAVPVSPEEIPESLLEPEKGRIIAQPDNAGFIAAPSVNHATTAAVLRNAYLTHADSAHPERMAVNLCSERVRTALQFLDGIRNGQELGALLGYQFERGLSDRHDDPSLSQFIPAFRKHYPLVADKITPGESGDQIETKEARNVFDGYTLIEQTILRDDPIGYPYKVEGLPPNNSANKQQVKAIKAEVERMADSLDAIADLSLAESVYQLAQGNMERSGAMMQAMTQGNHPPEPDIVRTPRSGSTMTHRMMLNLDSVGNPTAWPGDISPRAAMEPSLNEWLGQILGSPERIRFIIERSQPEERDSSLTIVDLGMQPIDLVYMLTEELGEKDGAANRDDTTELDRRIVHAFRKKMQSSGTSEVGDVTISFVQRDSSWTNEDKTVFELLPLLQNLRELITGCRPLSAEDLRLPSEANEEEHPNPKGYDDEAVKARVSKALTTLQNAFDQLTEALSSAEEDSAGEQEFTELAGSLFVLAGFGLPDAFPKQRAELLSQASRVRDVAQSKLKQADDLMALRNLTPDRIASLSVEDRIEIYRHAARSILDESFNLLPTFLINNSDEVAAAVEFRDAGSGLNLTRFSNNALIVDEWLQGVARVRDKMALVEEVVTFNDAFEHADWVLKPLQLPFLESDHWIAVKYPAPDPNNPDDTNAFQPEGDYLSIVQLVPSGQFDAAANQIGLLIDEWTETIPNKIETSGIAVHYNQPGSQPPQALLLAITPEVTGNWTWDDLEAILLDTMIRAKKRAVEPEHLGLTPFAQILPAILTAVSSKPFATISTDLVNQTEVAFSDLES